MLIILLQNEEYIQHFMLCWHISIKKIMFISVNFEHTEVFTIEIN